MLTHDLHLNDVPFHLVVEITANESHSNIKQFRDFLSQELPNHTVQIRDYIFKFIIQCDNFVDAAKVETFIQTQ
jgi:hypothetical protein